MSPSRKSKSTKLSLTKIVHDRMTNQVFGASLLSGILSGITFMMIPGALWVGPGFFFGIATAWVFIANKWLDWVQGCIWVAASTGAWYIAIRTYMTYVSAPGGTNDDLNNMLQAGLVGSLILALVFSLLVRKVTLKAICVTVICGFALAAVMNWILSSGSGTDLGGGSGTSYAKLAAAFAVWQVGVGLSLLAYKVKQVRS